MARRDARQLRARPQHHPELRQPERRPQARRKVVAHALLLTLTQEGPVPFSANQRRTSPCPAVHSVHSESAPADEEPAFPPLSRRTLFQSKISAQPPCPCASTSSRFFPASSPARSSTASCAALARRDWWTCTSTIS